MKRLFTILAAGLALLLAGCATDLSRYYDVQAKAIEADNNAVMALAAAAASGNQGAIMALALRKSAAGQIAVPQDKALQWASVLVPGLTNLYAIQRNTQIQQKQIEAETAQYGATLSTIGDIATQGIQKQPVIVGPSEGLGVLYPAD